MPLARTLLAAGGCAFALASCSAPGSAPPLKPAASLTDLMAGPVAHASATYWDAVSTTVDASGTTEKFPTTDAEWSAVWSAGITLGESGNLLMMAPRAKDNGDWMKWSAQMVDVGMEAAKAAEARDAQRVLAMGEKIYNNCVGCHRQYVGEGEVPIRR